MTSTYLHRKNYEKARSATAMTRPGRKHSRGLRPLNRLTTKSGTLLRSVILAALLAAPAASNAQSNHLNDYAGDPVKPPSHLSFASTEEARQVVAGITAAIGLSIDSIGFTITESLSTPYAVALIDADGDPVIAYNPAFMRKAQAEDWVSLAILAHEVGHHLNSHLPVKFGTDQRKLELEADHFSGQVLGFLGATLDQAQEAARLYSNDTANATHPAKSQRLRAIEEGWNVGSRPSTALQANQIGDFISQAKEGGTIQLAAGTFRLPLKLVLTNSVEIIGAGREATIVQAQAGRSVIHYSGNGTLSLRNLTVEYAGQGGANVISVASGNIDFRNITVQGSRVVDDFHGSGIRSYGTAAGTIRDSFIQDNQGSGVTIYQNASIELHGNEVVGNEEAGINVWDSARLHAEANSIRNNGSTGVAVSGTAVAELTAKNVISENLRGIWAGDQARLIVADNTISNNVDYGIMYGESASGSLSHNTFSYTLGNDEWWSRSAVQITGTGPVTADANTIRGPMHGVVVYGTTSAVFKNTLIDTPIEVWCVDGSGTRFVDTTFSTSGGADDLAAIGHCIVSGSTYLDDEQD